MPEENGTKSAVLELSKRDGELERRIVELEARLADLERLVVAGPGWVPSYLPPINSCQDAGRRVVERVMSIDSDAVTRPIESGEIEEG
jgi:hypothetical protein